MPNPIHYKLKRSYRARRVRLSVYCDGSVVVTSPFGVGQSVIEKFISEKANWIWNKLQFFQSADSRPVPRLTKVDYLKHKDSALALVKERIEIYRSLYDFSFNRISIKNQKTRWGSCSSKKNLSFNYKIVFLSEKLQDYLIVHELCHLQEMNHSRRFWALVAKAFPDYAVMKKELKGKEW